MKHLQIVDLTPDTPPTDLAEWMAARAREFEAEVAARRASWDRPRHLRVVDGGVK